MFQNRSKAGQMLAKMLLPYKKEDAVILGIPRGGVPVAYEIAKCLKKPLGIVLVKKIGHPMNKEYAIGAVSLEHELIMPNPNMNKDYIEAETNAIRQQLLQLKAIYKGKDYTNMQLKDKMVVLVDDGLATGYTMLNSIQLIKKCSPKKIIVAVPVAPKETVDAIQNEGAVIVVIEIPYFFNGIGAFYEDFTQVEHATVLEILNEQQQVTT